VEFQEILDRKRLTEAWKKTRSKEPFLRARSENKFVTTVTLDQCQENAQKIFTLLRLERTENEHF
jgi:hypothetical protein